LLVKLTGCSYEEAKRILRVDTHTPDGFNSIESKIQEWNRKPTKVNSIPTLDTLPEFEPIKHYRFGARYYKYIKSRGFTSKEAKEVISLYDLQYALTGNYKYRVIIPVRYKTRLVAWTARAIGRTSVRYLSSPASCGSIKDTVLNYDLALSGGKRLFICEGPFDAIKVDYFGGRENCHAICLFGKIPSNSQVSMIASLADRFDSIVVLLDADAWSDSMALENQLSFLKAKSMKLPEGIKDPGELTGFDVRLLCR